MNVLPRQDDTEVLTPTLTFSLYKSTAGSSKPDQDVPVLVPNMLMLPHSTSTMHKDLLPVQGSTGVLTGGNW